MPLQLDTFRNIAQTQAHQQVLLQTSTDHEGVKTRGSFVSWVVNLFRGEALRSEQRAVAQAFVQALQTHVQQGTGPSQQLTGSLKADYTAAMQDAILAVRSQLANQLEGTRALTTDDISSALAFISQVQEETLAPLLDEAGEAALLETAAQRLQAARGVAAQFDAVGTDGPSPGQNLADLISGLRPSPARVAATHTQVEALKDVFLAVSGSIRDLKNQAAHAHNPEVIQSMREALEAVQKEKIPVDALEWFNESHRLCDVVKQRIDTTTIRQGNGQELSNERTPRQLLDAFAKGEVLSAQDLDYLDAWVNRFPGVLAPTKWMAEMSNGERGLRVMQNTLYEISEDAYQRMGGGDVTIDIDLLDGEGGVTETPYRDQAVLSLWDRRDELVATLQDLGRLQAQARAAISAQGNMAQHTPGHVNPFRQVPANDASPLHAPNPEAVPGKSTLSTRHPREIAVQQETVEYHPPVSSEHDAEPAHYGISPAQKLSRAERVRALNAELGIAADNKNHLPGHAATERHAQAEVAIDPNVEPGRSIAQDFKGGVRSYDEAEGSGRDEAARPAHPRNPGV